jgi:DNA-binding NtrC family response regulator
MVIQVRPEIWGLIESEWLTRLIAEYAEAEGLDWKLFSSPPQALSNEEPDGGIILAIEAAAKFSNYLTVIKRFRKNFFYLHVMVFGPEKSADVMENERDQGVDLYFSTPLEADDFHARASHLASLLKLQRSAGILGRAKPMNEMLNMILQVAPTEVPVLIEGESGSGKELTAHAIHLKSRRNDKPFEVVNCGALAEGLLESELFGHERGSFTGAVSQRIGLFERANKGTLFLDEVGEMSLNMQVRLLRVIETGEFMRVGGSERIKTDVRLIAATNRELESAVAHGEFRKDLYFRLKVVQIRIPTLRSRRDDIPMLANYFIRTSSRRHGKEIKGVEKEGMNLLVSYPWPGNVRELSNTIDNLVVMSKDAAIRAEDIEKRLEGRMDDRTFMDLPVPLQQTRDEMERELIINSLLSLNNDVKEILRLLKGERQTVSGRWSRFVEVEEAPFEEPKNLGRIEKEAIMEALMANGGNRRKTAKQLGISERTLYRRLKEYEING